MILNRFYKKVRETYGETPPGDEMYADHPRMTERIARLYEVRAQIERDFDQFNYGVAALAESRYADAISAFRAFTSTFANSATGWTNLGTAYLFEAIAKVEGPPVRYMVTYYEQPKEILRGKPEELIEAEEAFRRSIEIDTAYNIVYYGNMGIIAALNGEYDRALEFTKKALSGNEGQHFFYNNLGNILFLKESYEDAADAYKKALDLNAYWPLPRYNLALTYETAGQKELAIDAWKELLDVSGLSGEAVKHLAALDSKFKFPASVVEPETCLAGVKIGMIEDDVRGLLGEPVNRIALEKIVALEYDVPGILVFIRGKSVSGVLADGAFQGATAKGIKIGSTAADVRAAYGLPEDIIQQKSDEQWVYGRVGLMVGVGSGYVNGLQLVEANQ
jgi:tetratricopeptide (TPR) repeat protein